MRTFVGFGLGPIQAGLFLAEAHASGRFSRLVVAEIQPDMVVAIRRAGGITVNVAHPDRVEALTLQPVEVYNPRDESDRDALVDAVARATEMATALPSVESYACGGAHSAAGILADGLRSKVTQRGPLAIVYVAENHPAAAARLEAAVMHALPAPDRPSVQRHVQFLDTVIGKMSGGHEESGVTAPLAPGLACTYVVESYNCTSISRVRRSGAEADDGDSGWSAYRRSIGSFRERNDLRPFAEAKLYGHNAGHALAAYAARLLGLAQMHHLRDRPDVVAFVRDAIAEESGTPLVRRYAGFDPLFTEEGFRAYAEDLVARMTSPFLQDSVARVGRDPVRKLAWGDRLIGAMRLAVEAGITPRRYAFGVAAALDAIGVFREHMEGFFRDLWSADNPDPRSAAELLDHIVAASERTRTWREGHFPLLSAE